MTWIGESSTATLFYELMKLRVLHNLTDPIAAVRLLTIKIQWNHLGLWRIIPSQAVLQGLALYSGVHQSRILDSTTSTCWTSSLRWSKLFYWVKFALSSWCATIKNLHNCGAVKKKQNNLWVYQSPGPSCSAKKKFALQRCNQPNEEQPLSLRGSIWIPGPSCSIDRKFWGRVVAYPQPIK